MTNRPDDGWPALDAGDWSRAEAAFELALTAGETAEARDGLGQAQFWLNQFADAVSNRERAYALYRQVGEVNRAADIAMWLAIRHATLYGNASAMTGWLARAERLLENAPTSREHARLAVIRASMAWEPTEIERHATEALSLARRVGDVPLEILALSYLGIANVASGHLAEGMRQLDETMAAVSGNEVANFGVIGEVYCNLLSACDQAADYRRALEWCEVTNAFVRRQNFTPLFAICRTFYGGVLTAVGRWTEAETELLTAVRLAETNFKAQRVAAIVRLAELRIRQGRLEEAEQLLKGYEDDWDALQPLAALRIARGEGQVAAHLIQRRLAHLHPANVMAGPLLALLVEAYVLEGDWQGTRDAVSRLHELANSSKSGAVAAMAELASGRVALAKADPLAVTHLEAATGLFADVGLPLELARARLELGRALASNRPRLAIEETRAALAVLEQLSAERDADMAAQLLRTLGAPGRTGPRGTGTLTKREGTVLLLLGEGLSNDEIAARLFISPRTAEHHVANVLAKLSLKSRSEATAYALRHRWKNADEIR